MDRDYVELVLGLLGELGDAMRGYAGGRKFSRNWVVDGSHEWQYGMQNVQKLTTMADRPAKRQTVTILCNVEAEMLQSSRLEEKKSMVRDVRSKVKSGRRCGTKKIAV